MKPMICTSNGGIRSRSSPASSARGSVVAASSRLASTPRVPFTSRPHAPSSPCSLSEHGLIGAWGLLAKGTLGVIASLLLAATTEPRALLAGLERLRVPTLLVQIMGFMVRYLDVVTDELRRMHVARESRGFSARNPRHWPVIAKSAGVLFIRSYERGERVHLAMLSRGYVGRMPRQGHR